MSFNKLKISDFVCHVGTGSVGYVGVSRYSVMGLYNVIGLYSVMNSTAHVATSNPIGI